MLIRRCEIEGALCDVRVRGARVSEVAPRLAPEPGENVREAAGGALLPGLNEHHAHLFAAAAALRSVRCGPPRVRDARQLEQALASAPGAGWLRGVGYHESVAGALDRAALDRWLPTRPARVQHRTGALWVLNSAAIAELGTDTREEGCLRYEKGHWSDGDLLDSSHEFDNPAYVSTMLWDANSKLPLS